MSNTLTGTVKQILDEQSGSGRNGTWRKREFILETEGKYPKPVCLVQWGDEIDATDMREGERITAIEYYERYLTLGGPYASSICWCSSLFASVPGCGRRVSSSCATAASGERSGSVNPVCERACCR